MGYKAIARLAANPGYYYARVIHKAMKGIGTDEETVIRHLVNTSEVKNRKTSLNLRKKMIQTCLGNVDDEFTKLTGKSLDSGIKSEFSGDAQKLLRDVVKGNYSQ